MSAITCESNVADAPARREPGADGFPLSIGRRLGRHVDGLDCGHHPFTESNHVLPYGRLPDPGSITNLLEATAVSHRIEAHGELEACRGWIHVGTGEGNVRRTSSLCFRTETDRDRWTLSGRKARVLQQSKEFVERCAVHSEVLHVRLVVTSQVPGDGTASPLAGVALYVPSLRHLGLRVL